MPERFWIKTLVSLDGCWDWANGVCNSYGRFTIDGRAQDAHRVAYRYLVGDPGGFLVRHRCDNRWCVNPGHLELGTHADNTRDMIERGRHFEQKKTECPRGHLLQAPNLVVSRWAYGVRNCLACDRAKSRVKGSHGLRDFMVECTQEYKRIMREDEE